MKDPTRSVTTPIYQTFTYLYPTDDPRTWQGEAPSGIYLYTRHENPTVAAVEDKLAALEGGDRALLFSSGMAAISTVLLTKLREGDTVLAMADVYGGSIAMLGQLPRYGIKVRALSLEQMASLPEHLDDGVRMVWMESPTNPTLKLVDFPLIAAQARERGALTVMDSTFATPCNQRPLGHGVDLVVHSCSKYLNGHSDLIGGAVIGARSVMEGIKSGRRRMGGVMDPHATFLLQRGMKTLSIRMERHNANGLEVARHLESHPQHELATKLMDGYGGMLAFDINGGLDEAKRFLRSLRLVALAPSLGGVESLASMPIMTSHAVLTETEGAALGITEATVRLSVGIEGVEDIIADLDSALDAMKEKPDAHSPFFRGELAS